VTGDEGQEFKTIDLYSDEIEIHLTVEEIPRNVAPVFPFAYRSACIAD